MGCQEGHGSIANLLPGLTNLYYIAKIDDIMARPQVTHLSHTHKCILFEMCRSLPAAASVSDLVACLNLSGASSIVPTLKIMERNGFVKILGGGKRGKRCSIVFTPEGKQAAGVGGIPLLGSIPAGPLSEAIEHCEEIVDLGATLAHQPGDFLLLVNGHSMTGDGILPGDKVLLRPGVQVRNGEIAAVHFGDQYLATLKHVCFNANGKAVTLRASNAEYPDVTIPGRELRIAGVFRGLVRSL